MARAPPRADAGAPSDAIYHFDKADVIVTLDADFLVVRRLERPLRARLRGAPPRGRRRRTRRLTRRACARVMNRALRHREHADAHRREGGSSPGAARRRRSRRPRRRCRRRARQASFSNAGAQKFIAAVAKDLQAHRGRSLVVAGDYQPAAVHHLAHAAESVARQRRDDGHLRADDRSQFDGPGRVAARSRAAMDAGQVDLLVILGVNPVFTAPADLKFQERLAKVAADGLAFALPRRDVDGIATGTFPRRTPSRAGATRARTTAPSRSCSRSSRRSTGRTHGQEVLGHLHRRADRQVRARSREGLLDARAGRQGRQLDDHRRDRPAVQERRQLLEARAARWVGAGNGALSAAAAQLASSPASSFRQSAIQPEAGSRQPEASPGRASRSFSGPTRRSGTAASRTTAGCRSCRSR